MGSIVDDMANIKSLADEINQDGKPVTDIKVLRGECPLEPGEKSSPDGAAVFYTIYLLLSTAKRLDSGRVSGPDARAMAKGLRQCAKMLQGERDELRDVL